ncbi:MAG: helix-turn-helix transcriptional regulator [Lachnospiraceae bacterium]|jgi:transcriptional regulator with XRE-family HTH domain|nr:helix-turn-helix transcriptional regulator [Lachnospiraceae bacterium]
MLYYERIREIRDENRYTQQTIANILNIGQRTYSDYESGRTRIPVESLIILAKFYNVSMDYISGVSDIRGVFPPK